MPAKAAPKPAAKAAPKPAAAAKPAAKAAPKAAAPKAAAPAAPRAAAGNANGVYVKGWGTGSVADATTVFSAAGHVVSAQVRRHRYVLVFFDNAAAVKKAIDLFNDKEVLGAKVSVVPARTSPKPDAHASSSAVFVAPIFRSSASKKQIMELFAGYSVKRVRTYRQNYAYAFLDSPASAAKFVAEKNGSEFRGHTLRVKASAKDLSKIEATKSHAKLVMDAHRAAAQ